MSLDAFRVGVLGASDLLQVRALVVCVVGVDVDVAIAVIAAVVVDGGAAAAIAFGVLMVVVITAVVLFLLVLCFFRGFSHRCRPSFAPEEVDN